MVKEVIEVRVGVCTIELYLAGVNSLKGKRGILHSIIDRIQNRYNVSVAEVGNQDLWQRATIALSKVSNDDKVIHRDFTSICNFIDDYSEAQLMDYEIRIS